MSEVTEYLEFQWRNRLEENRWAPEAPRGTWASNLGHPCLYYLWAQRARWDDATTPEPALLSIFDLGNHYEAYAKAKLRDAGFEILEEQRLYEDEELEIRGRIDGRIRTDDPGAPEILRTRKGVLAEIKGINDSDWSKFNTVEDIVNAGKVWAEKWPAQLLFYVDGAGDDEGVFCFVNKMTGEPKFVMVDLNEWHERILAPAKQRVSRINGYLSLGVAPKPMTYDPKYCARCDWAHICPTAASMQGAGEAVTMSSKAMDQGLDDVASLEAEGKSYQKSKTQVKAFLDASNAWPEEGFERTLMTDGYILLLKTKNGRHYWSIETERGEL